MKNSDISNTTKIHTSSTASDSVDINGSNWMSAIDSALPITAINIPGTHDSATKYCTFSLFSQTQCLTIEEQLYAGARYFDMRFELRNGEFNSVHSISACKVSRGLFADRFRADDAIAACKNFLKKNTGETVLFQLKEEHSSSGERFFEEFYSKYIKGDEKSWFLENRTPALGDVRGKIVLLRIVSASAEKFNDSDSGVNFRSYPYVGGTQVIDFRMGDICSMKNPSEIYTHMYVQDSYQLSSARKTQAITAFWNKALDRNNYNINMTNCIGSILFPIYTSHKVNAGLAEYEFTKGRYYGIVGMDFATDKLCKMIYMSNNMTETPVFPVKNCLKSKPSFLEACSKVFKKIFHIR